MFWSSEAFFSNGVTRAALNRLGNVPVFSGAFTILTRVNSVAVKVVFSSHVGSTSSGQHFVGLHLMIGCSFSASVEQRVCRLCDTGGAAGRAGITTASIVTFERVKPTTFWIFSSNNSVKPLHKISSFLRSGNFRSLLLVSECNTWNVVFASALFRDAL